MRRRRFAIFPIVAAALATIGLIALMISSQSIEDSAIGVLVASVTIAVLSLRED